MTVNSTEVWSVRWCIMTTRGQLQVESIWHLNDTCCSTGCTLWVCGESDRLWIATLLVLPQTMPLQHLSNNQNKVYSKITRVQWVCVSHFWESQMLTFDPNTDNCQIIQILGLGLELLPTWLDVTKRYYPLSKNTLNVWHWSGLCLGQSHSNVIMDITDWPLVMRQRENNWRPLGAVCRWGTVSLISGIVFMMWRSNLFDSFANTSHSYKKMKTNIIYPSGNNIICLPNVVLCLFSCWGTQPCSHRDPFETPFFSGKASILPL